MVEETVTVLNKAGLHARPSSMIVKVASKYNSEVLIGWEQSMVNAKSIMGVMTLGAGVGTKLIIRAEGKDEQEVIDEIKTLFERKFANE